MEWPPKYAGIHAALLDRFNFTSLAIVRDMSGASGAATYLCLPESSLGRPHQMVVKVGAAEDLSRDVDGLRLARTMYRNAGQMLDAQVEHRELIALPLSLTGTNAVPFAEWYTTATAAEAVTALDDLFHNVLRLDQLTLNLTNRSVFRCHTIDDPASVHRRLSALGIEGARLWAWWDQAFTRLSISSATRLAHGDLHGGNILVSASHGSADGPGIDVVDFGNVGEKHYLADFVSLERDIVLKLDPDAALEPERTEAVTGRLRELARAHAPSGVDPDFEYDVALATRFMFSAASAHASEELRRTALDHALEIKDRLEAAQPQFRHDRSAVRLQTRRMTLGLFAYSFLRLDQLPNGAWGRTVNNWMESLWAGDEGSITRDRKIRDNGGTDILCGNVINVVDYLTMALTAQEAAEVLNENGMIGHASDNIASRRGPLGGVGSRSSGRGANDVRIRHTVMALIALIADNVGHLGGHSRPDAAAAMAEYLRRYGSMWREDMSHLFGSTMATVRLVHLLGGDVKTTLPPDLAKDVHGVLTAALPDMFTALFAEDTEGRRLPRPTPPDGISLGQPFFWPYSSFWRMERSGLLMYLPLALVDGGRAMLPPVRERLGDRLASCLVALLAEVNAPFDPTDPCASLIHYHRGDPGQAHRDWGLSAELAALLEAPAIIDLLKDMQDEAVIQEKRTALRLALSETFDRYRTHPEIFHHTHAASFFRVLWMLQDSLLPAAALRELDQLIGDTLQRATTESALVDHVAAILRLSGSADDDVDSSALVSLLVNKLESGYYVDSATRIAPVGETIEAYRGAGARVFAELAGESHLRTVEPIMESLLVDHDARTRRALDLGTGTGRHAALLARMGFDVDIVDLSPEMLQVAAARLGIPAPPPADMLSPPAAETYEVVTVAESIIHLTRSEAQKLARWIADALTPQGVAYFTFQLNNNSVVTPDGRFYEYYSDQRDIVELLATSGLRAEVTTSRPVAAYERRMYPSSAAWTWFDVYCRRRP
ncbi:methyltransferase domain-containing protein [Actinomadura monticuli]|uniref:Methyltransferase domain-containing protein n=1 Tax=Actinomadura monticuli TaxID=3097367 RepID=A0ABV4QC52_9ACTN